MKKIIDNRLNQDQARFLRKRADAAAAMLRTQPSGIAKPKDVLSAERQKKGIYKQQRREESVIEKKYERISERLQHTIERWQLKQRQEQAVRQHKVNQRRQDVEKSILFGTTDEALRAVERLEADAAKVKC